MTSATAWGATVDPAELREIAAAIDADVVGWTVRVGSLPRCVLTERTLASGPRVIADRLRAVAVYLENRRAGLPFAGPEAVAAYRRERSAETPLKVTEG
jgi:hypothetical protein